MTPLDELFGDEKLCAKIRRKLPYLFALAEQQVSRGRKVGMEVGTLREQILVALLIHKFGEDSVNLDIPVTEHEVDVQVKGHPLSIKTITAQSKGTPAVKIVWTVDWEQVKGFTESYQPKCDMLLVIIRWGGTGGFYGIPLQARREVKRHQFHFVADPQIFCPSGDDAGHKHLVTDPMNVHDKPLIVPLHEPTLNPSDHGVVITSLGDKRQ